MQSWSGGELADSVGLSEGTGIITEWSFRAATGSGTLALQTLTEDLNHPGEYTPVGESAIETVTPSTLNTFSTRVPVTLADKELLGIRVVSGNPDCRYGGFPNDEVRSVTPAPLVGGGPKTYGSTQFGFRLNLQVAVEDDEDRDGFGDQTQDGCPRRAQRHDDCVKPIVTLSKGVPRKRRITFAFSSNEPGGTFECHLENKEFSACTSPLKLKNLKPGLHNFTVRAVDANNNKSGQTSFRWKVK